MTYRMNVFFCILLCVSINVTGKTVDTIVYPWFDDNKFKEDEYYLALLKLALENSKDEFGEYSLQKAIEPMFQNRAIVEIQNNRNLNIVWTMTSQQREKKLNPIRIPLLRGLGGYRIFLVKNGDQERFSKISNAEQLKNLIAGQGNGWPDSAILADNNYGLITGSGHERLFEMLRYGRFDYMPRALHEPWNEAKMFKGLEVESTLALHYPSPYYFFVSNDNPKLKKRIEVGLQKAEKNGSFQQLFDTHPVTKSILSLATLDKRKVFHLKNSFLSKETQQVVEAIEMFNFKDQDIKNKH